MTERQLADLVPLIFNPFSNVGRGKTSKPVDESVCFSLRSGSGGGAFDCIPIVYWAPADGSATVTEKMLRDCFERENGYPLPAQSDGDE